MNHETYTPGHTQNAIQFMAARTFASHGQFFAQYLQPTDHLLDAGCGPGTITVGLARQVATVEAIDFAASQTEAAQRHVEKEGLDNITFRTGSCYELPYEDQSFDRVFSHALLEHLNEPVRALHEFRRVLKPGGRLGVCSPDFGGRMLIPTSAEIEGAAEAYAQMQSENGGDLYIGRKLGSYVDQAGFREIRLQARYECYPSLEFISEYLALQLEQAEMPEHAECFRRWSQSSPGLFAQTWVSAVATKP